MEKGAYMADSIATAYVQIEPTFEGVGKKLKGGIAPEAGSAGKEAGGSFGSGFASVMGTSVKVAGAALVGAVSVGSAAVTKLTSEATANFGEFEQLVGGVETLFGNGGVALEEYMQAAKEQGIDAAEALATYNKNAEAQEIVLQNAANAYKTAGMDANAYMETVTSFSASLLQSLGGDTTAAANAADIAISDMSDNANKMGSSIESIQAAYMGFSKGQYQLLDNLKIGYGGTRTEMLRLLDDASKISGVKYDISSLSDVYEAIHVVQTEMGITGTTAREASSTLQGSFASMSAAWQNVLTSIGSGEDLERNLGTLAETAETYLSNLMPVIEQSLGGVSQLITNLAPVIAEKLPALVQTLLPSLLTAAGQLIAALGSAIQTALPVLLTTGTEVINTLVQGFLTGLPQAIPMVIEFLNALTSIIIENAPLLIEAAGQLILQLAIGLSSALPTLIPTVVQVVVDICMSLIDNIDLLIDAALQLMIGLASGLMAAIPVLLEKAPLIIGKLFSALLSAIPKLLEAGAKVIKMIIDGITRTVPQLLGIIPGLVVDLKNRFFAFVPEFLRVGSEIVEGIKKGISGAWDAFSSWMSGLLDSFVDGILSFFGIQSPSKLMADEVGKWIPAGIAEGIEQGMGVLDRAVDDMTADMLSTTLNPSMVQNYAPQASNVSSDLSGLMRLLQTYLPQIAAGDNVNISLEGDAGRLFRLMQREARRNTELVGVNAALSSL